MKVEHSTLNHPVHEDRGRWTDRYIQLVALMLAGYALFGRSFAAIGVHPVYIGEAVLALGVLAALWVLIRSPGVQEVRGRWTALPISIRRNLQITFLSLLGFILWGMIRTVPYIQRYGILTLRDAVIWGYGIYAIIVVVILLARPKNLDWLIRSYAKFSAVFLVLMPLVFLAFSLFYDKLPPIPGDYRPLFYIKAGDWLVHLAGISAYYVLLLPLVGLPWITGAGLVALEFFTASCINRGGFLAYLSGLIVVGLFGIKRRRIVILAAGIGLVLLAFGISGFWIEYRYHHREVSLSQFVNNIISIGQDDIRVTDLPRAQKSLEQVLGVHTTILEESPGAKAAVGSMEEDFSDPTLDDTVNFRISLWRNLLQDVMGGSGRWSGLGFGVNLIDVAEFQAKPYKDLRSPHNIHITVLARMGLIGLFFWVCLNASWGWLLLRLSIRSRRAGDARPTAIFIFLLAYWAALLVNASWDVYLEGPMGGLWYWVVIGVGLAAAALYITNGAELSREGLGDPT